MTKEELVDFLKNNHGKEAILELTRMAEKKVVDIMDVYQLSLEYPDSQIAFRSAWLLENIFFACPEMFESILPEFLEHYAKQENKSGQRHYSKIGMEITKPIQRLKLDIPIDKLEKLLEASFDWLIDAKTPVAVKCNCLDILYNLSGKESWIISELNNILEQNLLSNSPAILSRTKSILKKLKS